MDLNIIIFFAFFSIFVLFFIYKFVKSGSVSCALHGGKVKHEFPNIQLESTGVLKTHLELKIISRDNGDKRIGLDVVYKGPLAYEKKPVTLDEKSAQELISRLQDAVGRL